MKFLQIFLLTIILFFNASIFLGFFDALGDIPCEVMDWAYKINTIGFITSLYISIRLYKSNRTWKNILVYIPILYLIYFFGLYLAYRWGYINIYQDMFRIYGKGPFEECEKFPLKFLLKEFD